MRNLAFEDFLEALLRLSTLVALPTDDDVAKWGTADAGELMLELLCSPSELAAFSWSRRGSF